MYTGSSNIALLTVGLFTAVMPVHTSVMLTIASFFGPNGLCDSIHMIHRDFRTLLFGLNGIGNGSSLEVSHTITFLLDILSSVFIWEFPIETKVIAIFFLED